VPTYSRGEKIKKVSSGTHGPVQMAGTEGKGSWEAQIVKTKIQQQKREIKQHQMRTLSDFFKFQQKQKSNCSYDMDLQRETRGPEELPGEGPKRKVDWI